MARWVVPVAAKVVPVLAVTAVALVVLAFLSVFLQRNLPDPPAPT